tara:strand:+ start:233 stop:436 length:204 start_codon:yes stop_codon:yes gene_type:complete
MKKIVILFFLLFCPNYAYAYLDPGMGSYILAMLAAFFATLLTFFSSILEKIKNIIRKIFNLFKKNKK